MDHPHLDEIEACSCNPAFEIQNIESLQGREKKFWILEASGWGWGAEKAAGRLAGPQGRGGPQREVM